MKFDLPLFDRIRVKPDEDRRLRASLPACDWPGCAHGATHRAPKGRGQEREYWCFCLDHVREYNHSYNFFAGMSDDAVARYQKDAITGHRPTWKMGMLGGKRAGKPSSPRDFNGYHAADDPFDMFAELGARPRQTRQEVERRAVRNAERKALHALGLETDATRPEVKARFKELVKRHHPDANGGDRGSEDKLREIIEAYNYLKILRLRLSGVGGMMRDKPPFRADHVGSLLRTAPVREARARCARREIDAAALAAVEDREIATIIRRQEEVGLNSITDGEFRRSWWHLDFLWGLAGVERYAMDTGIQFAGVTTRAEGARVVDKLDFRDHPMIAHFRFLQAHTRRTPKMTIPAPSAMYGRVGRKPISEAVYPRLDDFFADLGKAYAKAVRAFADAGCRYLQLDEVFIAMLCDPKYREQVAARGDDPEKLGGIYADLINGAIADRPADMTITMHLCRGNYKSTHMGSGGYEAVQEILFHRANVDGYFMEFDTERAGSFAPLRLLPKGKLAVLGLVTTKTGRLETRDEIRRRIEEAAKFADIDQLCLSPQCGFASTEEGNVLAEDEQWAKLAMIVEIAREVWG